MAVRNTHTHTHTHKKKLYARYKIFFHSRQTGCLQSKSRTQAPRRDTKKNGSKKKNKNKKQKTKRKQEDETDSGTLLGWNDGEEEDDDDDDDDDDEEEAEAEEEEEEDEEDEVKDGRWKSEMWKRRTNWGPPSDGLGGGGGIPR